MKNNKGTKCSIYIKDNVYIKLKELAVKDNRSFNNFVGTILEEYLKDKLELDIQRQRD